MTTTPWQFNAHETRRPSIIGLCIECALRHHEYSQALKCPAGEENWSDSLPSGAWIDGRRYTLRTSFGIQKLICSECDREVNNVYVPSP
jgi:hypothetical protein